MAGHPKTPPNLTRTIPSPARVLTAIAVAKLRPKSERFEVRDAGCRGLRVIVQPSGHKSFHLRYWNRGKGHNLALGPVLEGAPETVTAPVLGAPLSLSDARLLAVTVLREIKSGRDPSALKRTEAPGDDTVAGVSTEYMLRVGPKLRRPKQREYDLSLINQSLGTRPIRDIKLSDLTRLHDHLVEAHGPAAAGRVIATWTTLASWHAGRTDDFSPPVIRRELKYKQVDRERVLTDDELRRVWRAANAFEGPFGLYVKTLLLTAARRVEVSDMRRSEIDDAGVWTIPASRVKTKRDVTLPLSRAAQEIIASLPLVAPGDVIFTYDGARPIRGVQRLKRRLDQACGVTGWRLHDLRRTARTLLSRAGVNADVAERCLGHSLGGIRATYDKHLYLEEMRDAFERLAAQVEAIVR